jgi:glucosamine-6-phosphate deaminase
MIMEKLNLSSVEKAFFEQSRNKSIATRIPYISVDNFPKLGLFTALRFIEWVSENPHGVISLPTGKTPEFFIKWTQRIVNNWNDRQIQELKKTYGLTAGPKPDFSQLQFVQIDEFYPISSSQHNSFYHYVKEYYIKGFGLEP